MSATLKTCAFIVGLFVASVAVAAKAPPAASPDENVVVEWRGTKMIRVPRDVTKVSVGSSEVVDVQAFASSPQLLITGKKLGTAGLTVWMGEENVVSYTIVVTHPVSAITSAIKLAVPQVQNLKIDAAGTSVIISGDVPSANDVERAGQIAAGYLNPPSGVGQPIGQVVNLLKTAGETQVQLEVIFSEVSRNGLKQMGANLFATQPGTVSGGIFNPSLNTNTGVGSTTETAQPFVAFPPNPQYPSYGFPMANTFGMLFALGRDTGIPISAALSVLSNSGYARTLAEPTLIALSGHEANFLAGGEFPVAIPGALGQIQIDWKKFGVQLKFVPTVVDDAIQLRMMSAVSDIDYSIGVKYSGNTIPGVQTKYNETVVRLRDGQSFAIGGLLSDKVRSAVDKIPLLGDVPILGMLFRSTSYRRDETELLVVVTARFVRPQSERATFPGEFTRADPTDLELFLLGSLGRSHESKEGRPPSAELKIPPPPEGGKLSETPVGPVGFTRSAR